MISALRERDRREMHRISMGYGHADAPRHRVGGEARRASRPLRPSGTLEPMYADVVYLPLRISWFLAAVWTAPATSLLFAR